CGCSFSAAGRRRPLAVSSHRLVRGDLALAAQGVQSCDVAAYDRESGGVVELAGRVTEAQLEQLVLRLGEALLEHGVGQLVELAGVCHQAPSGSRMMKRALIGSLWIARRIASRATGSGTPESSNSTRPGYTTATHCSGLPLPEPMRVSAGFCVTGLSGKMLIHTFPPRLM